MKNYTVYETIEDFLADDSFLKWARGVVDDETLEWEHWFAANPHKQEVVDEALRLLRSLQIRPARELSDEEVEAIVWAARPRRRSFSFGRWAAAAAVMLVVAYGSYRLYNWPSAAGVSTYQSLTEARSSSLIEHVNTTHQPLLVKLPDGSTVVLKSEAKISFNPAFGGKRREVFLDGEAIFDVIKNPARPFYVYSNELTTRVLGTSFIVKTSENAVTVSVKSGRVSVFHGQDNTDRPDALVLTPNQQVVFHRRDANLVREKAAEPVLPRPEIAAAGFEFNDTPLDEVFKQIQLTYGIQIVYDRESLSRCPLTASFTNRPLTETLDIICKAVEAHYDVLDGQIVIHGRGCRG